MLLISSSLTSPPSSSNPSLLPSSPPNNLHSSILTSNRRKLLTLLAIPTTPLLVFALNPIFSPTAAAGGLFPINPVQFIDSTEKKLQKMRPNTEAKRRSRPSSPLRDRSPVSSKYEPRSPRSRSSGLAPPVSILDREFVTENDITLLEEPNPNPRSFPYSVKQQCWEKAEKIKGRDPNRWRRDYLGNIVFRKLVGCPGCLCHDYDHILPYSKGGQSTLENCQVLQATVNRSKGNRTELSRAELIQKSSYCRVSGRDMDLLELSAYGNVRRGQDSGGCRIQ
ncbi:hypothetical protein UlMin_008281 [Ulmus minor]